MTVFQRRERTCRSKVGHDTREEAERVLERMERNGRSGNRVYECGFCGRFHLGRPSRSERRSSS